MKKFLWLIFPVIFLFVQCNFITGKKPKEETPPPPVEKTAEELLAEEKARQDSIENAEFEKMQKTAFGSLMFGMKKDTVEKLNENRQKLGKYSYNFNYSFNGENQLYRVKLSSDGVKVIQFDDELKYRYNNLFQIVKTKYGEPATHKNFPSVFDVQNSKRYQLDQWEKGTKQINLALQENGKNSYSATCEILDKNMFEAEQLRLKNLKNKDIIEASESF